MTYTHCKVCGKEKKHARSERCNSCCKLGSKNACGKRGKAWNSGKEMSAEFKLKCSIAQGGTGEKQRYPGLGRWTRLVKQRDGHCYVCLTTEKLEAHHILHKASFPELATSLDNGIALCKGCHTKLHHP